MDDLSKSLSKAIREQQKSLSGAVREQQRGISRAVKEQQKAVIKAMHSFIRKEISKEGRVRIPAKRRNEVKEKYHNKCAVCKKKPVKTLQIHHKDMRNNNNALSNLELLCPNHHIQRHEKKFRKIYKDSWGNRRGTRLVKKKNET